MKLNFKKLILAGLSLSLITIGGCAPSSNNSDGAVVAIEMQNGGVIEVQLDAEAAPLTVENYLGLIDKSFYDGLTFHRIEPGFVIQGGDPKGNGTGGSDQTIKGEFTSNGFNNPIKHERGVISMARSQDKNSASCQFFIVLDDAPHLDGEYAAFGKVISGMDVVDDIASKPSEKPVIKSITRK